MTPTKLDAALLKHVVANGAVVHVFPDDVPTPVRQDERVRFGVFSQRDREAQAVCCDNQRRAEEARARQAAKGVKTIPQAEGLRTETDR